MKELQETVIWRELLKREKAEGVSLSSNALSLCLEAAERMKLMQSYAPQYTLHDETHLIRVVELMGLILSDQLSLLNSTELFLLLLSAYYHDQGMIPSSAETDQLASNEEFQLFRSNWFVEHPNYKETSSHLAAKDLSDQQREDVSKKLSDLNAALLTDFLRSSHGKRSAELVRKEYGNDPRLTISKINLAPLLADLCESHTISCKDFSSLDNLGFDEQIGTGVVNSVFIATVLRLADILDFDRDRTPEILLKSIHFTSPVSLFEWQKHRSVQGWSIAPDKIRFTIKCEHPAYEVAARTYMDWIDAELRDSHEIIQTNSGPYSRLQLKLPISVDRSRIQPKEKSYKVHDLEFGMSRNDIVRLLMTDKLYGSGSLCVRELLQNSLDAIRLRKAFFSEKGTEWIAGKVVFRHYANADGYEFLECSDNGVGMDEHIIQNYFVKIGRSYYRSPSFERDRSRLKASGNDFDPCAQFGIGFMSCFMLGDLITLKTRRDYGIGKAWGPPLIVEIHGLSGIIILRDGEADQPVGTTVIINRGKMPSLVDSWTDRVDLCRVLEGYALATEFPISACCEVPGIESKIDIPPIPYKKKTKLESLGICKIITLESDLRFQSEDLNGYARQSFLVDDFGIPTLSNEEAAWNYLPEPKLLQNWHLVVGGEKSADLTSDAMGVQVCLDGILVAGPPGRNPKSRRVAYRLGSRNSGIYSRMTCLVDARGNLKPEITPARRPPESALTNSPPGWSRLKKEFIEAQGLLWEKIAYFLKKGLSPDVFWKLCFLYDTWPASMPSATAWRLIPISKGFPSKAYEWYNLDKIGPIKFSKEETEYHLLDQDGLRIGPSEDMKKWEGKEDGKYIHNRMNEFILLNSVFGIEDEKIILHPTPPAANVNTANDFRWSGFTENTQIFANYSDDIGKALSIESPVNTVNRSHPLAELRRRSRFNAQKTDIEIFADSFLSIIGFFVSKSPKALEADIPDYRLKRAAHFYFGVSWENHSPSMRAPYYIWTSDGWITIDETELNRWKNSTESNNC